MIKKVFQYHIFKNHSVAPLETEVSTKLGIFLESYTFGPVRSAGAWWSVLGHPKLTGSTGCSAVSTAKPVLWDAPSTAWFDSRLIILSTRSQQPTEPRRTQEKIKPVWTLRTKTKQLTFLWPWSCVHWWKAKLERRRVEGWGGFLASAAHSW